MLGFIHFQSVNKLFILIFSLNRSTNVSEKIVFRGRQKSGGRQTSSFAILDQALARANCKCAWLCVVGFNHII